MNINNIMKNSLELSILENLIKFNTDTEKGTQFKECADFIKSILYKIPNSTVEYYGEKDRPLIYCKINNNKENTIGFCCHYDVVPVGENWIYDPWKLTISGDKAYGRGATDDKGNIASLLAALIESKNFKYNIEVIITPDEEQGGKTLKNFLDNKKIKSKKVIVLDHNIDSIMIGCSGVIEGKLRIFGKGGHAGYDFKTENPLWKLDTIFTILKHYKTLREQKKSKYLSEDPNKRLWGRFNITQIHGGYKTNIIPDYVDLFFDIRLIPEENEKEVFKDFSKFLELSLKNKNIKYDLKKDIALNGYVVDEKYVTDLKMIAEKILNINIPLCVGFGGSDSIYFIEKGIPAIIYGCGRSENNIHTSNEFVYIKDLQALKKIIKTLISN